MAIETTPSKGNPGKIDNIALSLSGGGVRAVGFHLGTLEMLDKLELLKKVSILSTVSGGSLTGTGYALSQHLGQSFDTYFHNFYDFLPNLNTIEHLLAGLASKEDPSPSGRRDMITVMANVYDDQFFKKYFNGGNGAQGGDSANGSDGESPRFKMLLDQSDDGSHLREIIFNATEFQTGTAFRFQKSEYRCLIGNANIQLCERHARQIRMADIMAASSCIPAGMEPLFFPYDFHWPDDDNPENGTDRPTCKEIRGKLRERLRERFLLHEDDRVDYFALMDGGVYDNQGIVSVLLAMNRQAGGVTATRSDKCVCGTSLYGKGQQPGPDDWARWFAGKSDEGSEDDDQVPKKDAKKADTCDLIIISDTPVRKDSFYPKLGKSATGIEPVPAQNPERDQSLFSGLTVAGLDRIGWGITLLLALSVGWTVVEELWPAVQNVSAATLQSLADELLQVLIPTFVMLVIAAMLMRFRHALRELGWKIYKVMPSSRWKEKNSWGYLRKFRLSDLFDMASLRVGSVSALTASIFMNRIRSLSYSAAYSREDMEDYIIANQIFALERDQDTKKGPYDIAPPISDDASAIVTLAANMPTKLWINEIDPEPPAENGQDAQENKHDHLQWAKDRVYRLNDARKRNKKKPLDELDLLVICGQLTLCDRIMQHLWNQYRDEEENWIDPDTKKTFERACEYWKQMIDSPTSLLDERKEQAEVDNVLHQGNRALADT